MINISTLIADIYSDVGDVTSSGETYYSVIGDTFFASTGIIDSNQNSIIVTDDSVYATYGSFSDISIDTILPSIFDWNQDITFVSGTVLIEVIKESYDVDSTYIADTSNDVLLPSIFEWNQDITFVSGNMLPELTKEPAQSTGDSPKSSGQTVAINTQYWG